MVILTPQSEVGHAPPPQTPYSLITNFKDWETTKAFRESMPVLLPQIRHIYPRLMPTHYGRELSLAIAKKLEYEDKSVFMYLDPAVWAFTKRHVTLPARGEAALNPDDVMCRCVDIGGHRLYVILFDPLQKKGIALSWAMPGVGISIRGAEYLLQSIDTMVEVPIEDIARPPAATYTHEGETHQKIKERIVSLLHRAPIDSAKVTCQSSDVFLYPTGMATVFRTSELLLQYRPEPLVVLGVVFHHTQVLLEEESPHGRKMILSVDEKDLDHLETWLDDEGQWKVSYVYVEFPGNPTLDSVDLKRLKKLSEKHGFVLIVDDTVSGFGNVDVLAYSDILLTSLTKSFSGQADVMGGSIVLNPLSPHYKALSQLFKANFRNELFEGDAKVLLANSHDFLERTVILNRNAAAVAEYLYKASQEPDSPIALVQFPSVLPSKALYDAFTRPSTADLKPGYGCLLTVEFKTLAAAIAFHDSLGFYPSPHLGGHVSIQFAYAMTIFGKKKEEQQFMRQWKVKEESVRISVGLESEEDVVDTVRFALEAAVKVHRSKSKTEVL